MLTHKHLSKKFEIYFFLLINFFCFFNVQAQDAAKQKVIQTIKSYVGCYLSFAKKTANEEIIIINLPTAIAEMNDEGFISVADARNLYLKSDDAASVGKLDNLETDALLKCRNPLTKTSCSVYFINPREESRDIISETAFYERIKTKIVISNQHLSSEYFDLKSSNFGIPSFLEQRAKEICQQVLNGYQLQIDPEVQIFEKDNNTIKVSPLIIKWLYILSINNTRVKSPRFEEFISNLDKKIKKDRQADVADYKARLNIIKNPFENSFKEFLQKIVNSETAALNTEDCEKINTFKNGFEDNEVLMQLFKSINDIGLGRIGA